MDYNQPTGGNPGDPYVGKNLVAGTQGSKVPPHAVEYPQREIVNAITLAGLTPSNGDLTQLAQAIALLAPSGAYKNKFRNAGCAVAQRGSSLTMTAGTTVASSSAYSLDGLMVTCTGANVTAAQAGSIGKGPNSLQITGGSGVTDVQVIQPIESIESIELASSYVVFQCKVVNNAGASFTPSLTVKTAGGGADSWGSSTVVVNAQALQVCPNGATTQLSYLFLMPASAVNGVSVRLDFGGALNGISKNIQIGDFDIRAGVAGQPPGKPEIIPYFNALLRCQRYLPGITADPSGGSNQYIGLGGFWQDTIGNGGVTVPFFTRTRTQVTGVVLSSLAHFAGEYRGNTQALTSLVINSNANGANVGALGMTATVGGPFTPTAGETSMLMALSTAARLYFTGAEINGSAI